MQISRRNFFRTSLSASAVGAAAVVAGSLPFSAEAFGEPRREWSLDPTPASTLAPPNIRELVVTLFELGREVTSVLDLDELLQKIPQLISRLTTFQAFAVYLLDPARNELSIAFSAS